MAPKDFEPIRTFRRFQSVFISTKSSPNMPKVLQHVLRIRLKHLNVLGEYAKNILQYMGNTPIDIKLSLSRRIFDQNQNKFQILNHHSIHDRIGKNQSHATVPLRTSRLRRSIFEGWLVYVDSLFEFCTQRKLAPLS